MHFSKKKQTQEPAYNYALVSILAIIIVSKTKHPHTHT